MIVKIIYQIIIYLLFIFVSSNIFGDSKGFKKLFFIPWGDEQGKLSVKWAHDMSIAPRYSTFSDFDVNKDGTKLVFADCMLNRIQIFDSNGDLILCFEIEKWEDVNKIIIKRIKWDYEENIVAIISFSMKSKPYNRNYIYKFNNQGKLIGEKHLNDIDYIMHNVYVDINNNIYFINKKFDKELNFIEEIKPSVYNVNLNGESLIIENSKQKSDKPFMLKVIKNKNIINKYYFKNRVSVINSDINNNIILQTSAKEKYYNKYFKINQNGKTIISKKVKLLLNECYKSKKQLRNFYNFGYLIKSDLNGNLYFAFLKKKGTEIYKLNMN